jgi:extradiol dioxygenase family protein
MILLLASMGEQLNLSPKGHKLRVFKNRMLRRVFGCMRGRGRTDNCIITLYSHQILLSQSN